MGIPHLFKWLRGQNYKGVLRRSLPSYVSSFSLDFNGMLHEVAQTVYAYGNGENPQRKKLVEKADPQMLEVEYYQALATKLSEVISQVRPQEILVLAIDGVAPQAKIAQQRQRRFRSALDSPGPSVFDSSALTPGTEFMKRVDNFLQRWLVSAAKTLPPKVIYSSHMVPAEGEHKILSLMRNGEISGDGAHVIYGMDADLIMLSLLAPLDKIYLMREDIGSIIDIQNLRTSIQEELVLSSAIHDFVVMIFLLGNDFLPHLVTLTNLDASIETMMQTYKTVNQKLTAEGDIYWPGLSAYLQGMALEEPRLLEAEARREVKHPSRMMSLATERIEKVSAGKVEVETIFQPDVFRAAWYENAFGLKSKTNVMAKLLPGHKFGSSNNKIVDMVKAYLVGIAWVYRYYSLGKEFVNNDFVYRYHYAPLLSDIHFVSQNVGQTFQVQNYEFNPEALEINPVHQLLSVLPLKSKKLLPVEVQHLTKKDSPIADYFPQSEVIERDGMNTDWQGVILINFIDMSRVLRAVETTSLFTEERIREFSPTYNIVLTRDPEIASLDNRTQKFRDYLAKESGRGRGRGEGTQRQPYDPNRGSGRDRGDNKGFNKKPYEQSGKGRGGDNKGFNKKPYEQSGRGSGRGRGRGRDNKKPYIPRNAEQKTDVASIPPLPILNNKLPPRPLTVKKFEL